MASGDHAFDVRAVDKAGNTGPVSKLTFKVITISPPTAASGPNPVDGAKDVRPGQNLNLSWRASNDPDGGSVKYRVSLGVGDQVSLNLVEGCKDVSASTCLVPASQLSTGKIHYWRVTAIDDEGEETDGRVWSFVPCHDWDRSEDVSCDGAVDLLDLVAIGLHWGKTDLPWWVRADVNQDGLVDSFDLALVEQRRKP